MKEKGYEKLRTAVTAIADPAYKQLRLEIMAWEDARKEKAQELRESKPFSMEQHSGDLGEYERLLAQMRKNQEDLNDSTLADDS